MEEIRFDDDYITDLRILLNKDLITREKFYELQNLLKVMPELYELAKEND